MNGARRFWCVQTEDTQSGVMLPRAQMIRSQSYRRDFSSFRAGMTIFVVVTVLSFVGRGLNGRSI